MSRWGRTAQDGEEHDGQDVEADEPADVVGPARPLPHPVALHLAAGDPGLPQRLLHARCGAVACALCARPDWQLCKLTKPQVPGLRTGADVQQQHGT